MFLKINNFCKKYTGYKLRDQGIANIRNIWDKVSFIPISQIAILQRLSKHLAIFRGCHKRFPMLNW